MNYGYEDYYYANLNPNDRERLLRIAENFNTSYGYYPMSERGPLNLYNANSPATLRNIANGIMQARQAGYIPADEYGLVKNYNYLNNY